LREVVLLQKIYGRVSLARFEDFLKEMCGGLKVEFLSLDVENGWVKVKVSGEDEDVAVRFLEREVGLAPVAVENVSRFSVIRGRILFSGRSKMEVFVDFGVLLPKPVYAFVPLQRLQGQLVDGGKFALRRIAELFGLIDGFPLEVRIVRIGVDELEVELTEGQLALYGRWIDSRVDRLVVLGESGEGVEKAVRRAGVGRDVLGIELLGALEHVMVCKLGTDAAGLAPKLGKWLSGSSFIVFSPRRVLGLVGGNW
jgi:hypothetical protein